MTEVLFPIPTADGVKINARLEYDEANPTDRRLMALVRDQWIEVDHYEEIFTLPGGGNASISININELRTNFDAPTNPVIEGEFSVDPS